MHKMHSRLLCHWCWSLCMCDVCYRKLQQHAGFRNVHGVLCWGICQRHSKYSMHQLHSGLLCHWCWSLCMCEVCYRKLQQHAGFRNVHSVLCWGICQRHSKRSMYQLRTGLLCHWCWSLCMREVCYRKLQRHAEFHNVHSMLCWGICQRHSKYSMHQLHSGLLCHWCWSLSRCSLCAMFSRKFQQCAGGCCLHQVPCWSVCFCPWLVFLWWCLSSWFIWYRNRLLILFRLHDMQQGQFQYRHSISCVR